MRLLYAWAHYSVCKKNDHADWLSSPKNNKYLLFYM